MRSCRGSRRSSHLLDSTAASVLPRPVWPELIALLATHRVAFRAGAPLSTQRGAGAGLAAAALARRPTDPGCLVPIAGWPLARLAAHDPDRARAHHPAHLLGGGTLSGQRDPAAAPVLAGRHRLRPAPRATATPAAPLVVERCPRAGRPILPWPAAQLLGWPSSAENCPSGLKTSFGLHAGLECARRRAERAVDGLGLRRAGPGGIRAWGLGRGPVRPRDGGGPAPAAGRWPGCGKAIGRSCGARPTFIGCGPQRQATGTKWRTGWRPEPTPPWPPAAPEPLPTPAPTPSPRAKSQSPGARRAVPNAAGKPAEIPQTSAHLPMWRRSA